MATFHNFTLKKKAVELCVCVCMYVCMYAFIFVTTWNTALRYNPGFVATTIY